MIITCIGGFNVNQILPYLNYDLIKANPKILCGYSDITALDVAKHCNLSYSYFSRTFKKIMKQSFTEYLNSYRISKAEYLLSATDKSIVEIADELGFSTPSYFIQQFKAKKNISPKKYRTNFTREIER